jgi:AraC-like DNA-binding protein
VGIDSFRAALEAIYPGNASEVDVIDFFGRDVALSHLCAACADLLSARVPGSSRIVADLTQLFATYLAEKYTSATSGKPEVRGGLPIRQLQKVGDFVTEHLVEEISVEILAQLVQLSPFHFSRIFKQSTGMSPLRFVTRERVTRAQQLIRETSRSPQERNRLSTIPRAAAWLMTELQWFNLAKTRSTNHKGRNSKKCRSANLETAPWKFQLSGSAAWA